MSTLAALLALTLAMQDPAPPAQSPGAAQAEEPVSLEDVVVQGHSLEQLTRQFVDEVAAPPPRRGIARWRNNVCFSVVNLQPAVAQPLIDHISRVAMEQDVEPAPPGCRPNVMIIFSDDAQALAQEAVDRSRDDFRLGVGGLDRGNPALRAFQQSDAPVRWWHTSMPINAQTGAPGIRLPGRSAPYVPGEGIVNRGRWVRDDLSRVIVIVDIGKVAGLSVSQLGDYLAVVSLAQVDPEADVGQYATILNLFEDPAGNPGLTDWDRAYLRALYSDWAWNVDGNEQTYQLLRNLRRDRQTAERSEAAN